MHHATGTFQVTLKPAEASEIAKSAGLAHMTIEKTWSGALQGTSTGEMTMTTVPGSGAMAYVALEKVTATLDGRSSTFVFQHHATMLASDPKSGVLNIAVVPHSGTDALDGIEGTLQIDTSGGGHAYDFAYTLPAAK